MHLVGEWLMAESGGKAIHVPFKGGTAPLTEILAGRVDLMIDTMTSTALLINDKRLRALALTSAKGESHLAIARLHQELKAVVEQADVKQKLISWGGSPKVGSPGAFKLRVETDIQNMKRIVSTRNIEME
jgi:tripartite-type tricarboxylate transporter receptor subunit TctC